MILNYHNTQIYYKLSGTGPAIVLLHGFLESSRMWDYFVPILAQNSTVITIDLPGHGKSGFIGKEHGMELMADVVFSILNKHQIQKGVFAGHSMGGYVALAIAEKYADSIDKLILINSTPAEDSEERKINRDRAIKVIVKNPEAFISMAISNLFAEETRDLYKSEILRLKKEAMKFPVEGIIATISGMKNRKDRISVLKKINTPKFMICGIDDPIIPYETCKIEASETNTTLISTPGGHMSWIENQAIIAKILTLT
ncbi:alpha/beta fold hydrolase [Ulvibacter antarcticus]|uniref:Pimeloyl-ACP methyl ester carboxylesterase n=1 Tax=Ulvibacter antarcticus TaxID=442714 RepID=A0A3L9YZR8_9FLAO|nr:alpha/beta hydrolase [Ulvibacter antarcticus]RMA65814.1 pimeloyl-ACP methyl ester carboxylesterase [Ulvibacter antarcticus]